MRLSSLNFLHSSIIFRQKNIFWNFCIIAKIFVFFNDSTLSGTVLRQRGMPSGTALSQACCCTSQHWAKLSAFLDSAEQGQRFLDQDWPESCWAPFLDNAESSWTLFQAELSQTKSSLKKSWRPKITQIQSVKLLFRYFLEDWSYFGQYVFKFQNLIGGDEVHFPWPYRMFKL